MKPFILFLLSIFLLIGCNTNEKPITEEPEQTIDSTSSEQVKVFKEINEQIKNDINNTGLYLRRARLFQQYGAIPKAIEDVDRAISIDSLVPEFYLLKAQLLKSQYKLKEVKEVLDKCMFIDNKNVQARIELGWLALIAKDYKQALDYADAALKRDMYAAEAYFLKGMIFIEKKDTATAISSFKTAVEQENDYYDAYIQLGVLHIYKKGNLSEGYFKNALRIKPKNLEALYNLGFYYQEVGEYKKAIETYKETLAIKEYREPYFNLGYIHQEYLSAYEEAIGFYTKAIEIEPKYIDAYYNRGLCYEKMKNKAKAKADFQEVLKLNPTHTFAAIALERVF